MKSPGVRVLLLLCKNAGFGIFLAFYSLIPSVSSFCDSSMLSGIYVEKCSHSPVETLRYAYKLVI